MYLRVLKANPNHYPAGTPGGKGGQFAPKKGKPEYHEGDDYEAYRAARNQWTAQMGMAVAHGEVPPNEAYKQGWSPDDWGVSYIEHVQPLPEELYHVTTARDAVLAQGLKTREELNQQSGAGLGGGSSSTISFTTDKKIARDIYRAMRIAHGVLNGKISVATLMEAAEEGKGANSSWVEGFKKTTGNPEFVDGGPTGDSGTFEEALTGYSKRRGRPEIFGGPEPDNTTYRYGNKVQFENPWELVGPAPGSTGKPYDVQLYRRKMTDVEVAEKRMEVLKSWFLFREAAGGPSDPLFIFNDPIAFKNLPEKQISMLKYKPKPGAHGGKVAGMAEYRVPTGSVVILDKILKEDD